jgi:hypothetical protein
MISSLNDKDMSILCKVENTRVMSITIYLNQSGKLFELKFLIRV